MDQCVVGAAPWQTTNRGAGESIKTAAAPWGGSATAYVCHDSQPINKRGTARVIDGNRIHYHTYLLWDATQWVSSGADVQIVLKKVKQSADMCQETELRFPWDVNVISKNEGSQHSKVQLANVFHNILLCKERPLQDDSCSLRLEFQPSSPAMSRASFLHDCSSCAAHAVKNTLEVSFYQSRLEF